MSKKQKIFCIIPAYNEEKTIIEVVGNVKPLVDEVVVIDDGSDDRTGELAGQQGITVLKHIINRGQGAALSTGNSYALTHDADIIVHFDADGQFSADEIKDIVRPIKNKAADIVFGSRFLEKRSDIPWLKKRVILPAARLVNRYLLKIDLTDPQSGFRAFSRGAAAKIEIERDGMAHCSEIMIKAFAGGLRVQEVSITVRYKEFGQNFFGGVRIIADLIIAGLIN